MLTLFRRIRKGLFEGGKTSKYLLYALGEIALVVIGILIALQINNWNEGQKDSLKETKLLIGLIENLELNVNTLKRITTDFREDDLSSNLIISVIKEKRAYHDSLDYHFARALNAEPLYVISYVGYESMKNTGFDIIHDEQLKKEIINLFELTYNIAKLRQNNITDISTFIGQTFMRPPRGWRYKPFDFNELIEDKEFLSLINGFKSNRWYIGRAYEEALTESQRVLQLIKKELGEE